MNNNFKLIQIENNNNYYCDNKGNIFSLKRNKIMKKRIDKDGYEIITLWLKKRVDLKVHRAVAITFIRMPKNGEVVNHKNFIKNDNRVENLEWVSQKENYHHSKRSKSNDFYNPIKWSGELHGLTKLTNRQAEEIRKEFLENKVTKTMLAKKYQVSFACIHRIIKNETYKKV